MEMWGKAGDMHAELWSPESLQSKSNSSDGSSSIQTEAHISEHRLSLEPRAAIIREVRLQVS